jgi:MFS family permease
MTTSISPVLLIFFFKEFSSSWRWTSGLPYLIIAILLLVVLKFIIETAKRKLEIIPIYISEISNADKESLIFIFTYFIPLLEIDSKMIFFLLILFFIIIFTTNIYFNPLLGLLGYRQYKVKLKEGTTFILITKKTLINVKQVKSVVQLTDYILLEKEEERRY